MLYVHYIIFVGRHDKDGVEVKQAISTLLMFYKFVGKVKTQKY